MSHVRCPAAWGVHYCTWSHTIPISRAACMSLLQVPGTLHALAQDVCFVTYTIPDIQEPLYAWVGAQDHSGRALLGTASFGSHMLICSERKFTGHNGHTQRCTSLETHWSTQKYHMHFVYLLVHICQEIGHLAKRAYSSCTRLLFLSTDALIRFTSKSISKTPSNLLTVLNAA